MNIYFYFKGNNDEWNFEGQNASNTLKRIGNKIERFNE